MKMKQQVTAVRVNFVFNPAPNLLPGNVQVGFVGLQLSPRGLR